MTSAELNSQEGRKFSKKKNQKWLEQKGTMKKYKQKGTNVSVVKYKIHIA